MSTLYFSAVCSDGVERLAHLGLEALVDFLFGPEIAVAVLHPLEVRRRDAGAVGEDVRHDEDAALVQVLVRVGRGGAVGALDDDLGAIAGALSIVIWFSSAAGIRMSTSSANNWSLVSGSAPVKPATVLLLLRVLDELRNVESGRVVDAAFPVGDSDDLRADAREQIGGHRADVAETLHARRSRP